MDTPAVVSGMATFLSTIGSVVTAAIGWMTSWVGAITAEGNEMLLVFMALPLLGIGITCIKRMISVN